MNRVRIKHPSRLLHWLHRLGFSRDFVGLTLGSTIHVAASVEKPIPTRLLRHEMIHVEQWRRLGRLGFPLVWGWQCLRHGYDKAPLEVEAREGSW